MVVFVVTAFSAALTACGFLFPSVWFLGILGFLPFIYVLRTTSTRSLSLGWVFGAVYAAVASACMFWSTLPLDWLGSNVFISVFLVAITWGTLAVLVGAPVALFGLLVARARMSGFSLALYGASVWTLCQYFQSWAYALATVGDNSVFEPHISSLSVGYSLASFSPFLYLAPLGGVYALTFAAIFLAFVSYVFLSSVQYKTRVWSLCSVLLFFALITVADRAGLFTFNAPSKNNMIDVALVTTYFPTEAHSDDELRERARVQIEMVREWKKTHEAPDIIVFPEAAQILKYGGLRASEFLGSTFGTSTAFIDSGTAELENRRTVQMQYYDAEGSLVGLYDKVFLVGFGEYIPWLYSPFISLMSSSDMSAALESRTVARGNKTHVVDIAGARIGGLFCMEIMSPLLYRELARDGAQVLVNASSQSFFHGSPFMDTYTLLIAKVRAAENARYLLIAGNDMRSTVISDRGHIVARSTPEDPILAVTVPLRDSQTPFTRFGDAVLILPLLSAIALFVWDSRKRVVWTYE